MSNYPIAKSQFREWVQGEGENRGYSPKIDKDSGVIVERPHLLARTRASVEQQGTLKFKINDEMKYENNTVKSENEEFDTVCSIILDLHDGRKWDAEQDAFYPLPLRLISNLKDREDINGDHPITIDLSHDGVDRHKNRLQTLFPIEEEEEEGQEPIQIDDNKIERLNRIAKDL